MRKGRLKAELRSLGKRTARWSEDHRKTLKRAVVIGTIIAAFVFFGENGENRSPGVLEIGTVPAETAEEAENGDPVAEIARSGNLFTGAEAPVKSRIFVDISGAVEVPGVYELEEGARLAELVELAGGLAEEADIDAINRASEVRDGQKVYIPKIGERAPAAGGESGMAAVAVSDGRVDVNHASSEELQRLPGVGPATAEKIIAYREANGPFAAPEDLKRVSGIGEKTFAKMADLVVCG